VDQQSIQQAATRFAQARRTATPLPGLPDALRPSTIAAAHAIQRATAAELGLDVVAYKASAPTTGQPTLGLILAGTVMPSPAVFPVSAAPLCGVEAEIAFRFRHDLPPRDQPYRESEVAACVDALVAIEIVDSRFGAAVKQPEQLTELEKLADNGSNAGLVFGPPVTDWAGALHAALHVTLAVNGRAIVDQQGGHPSGDPLAAAVALANMLRETTGVKAGQYVTCGSWGGLHWVNPGDRVTARFETFGEVEVTFA
jgi:2-keto-4-pentenoate hydratase